MKKFLCLMTMLILGSSSVFAFDLNEWKLGDVHYMSNEGKFLGLFGEKVNKTTCYYTEHPLKANTKVEVRVNKVGSSGLIEFEDENHEKNPFPMYAEEVSREGQIVAFRLPKDGLLLISNPPFRAVGMVHHDGYINLKYTSGLDIDVAIHEYVFPSP